MRASTDRLSALQRMSLPDLVALLSRIPSLTRQLSGGGGGMGYGGEMHDLLASTEASLPHLAVLLSSPAGIERMVSGLNRLERQLLVLAALHDGAIERSVAVGEAGDAPELDLAVDALANLLLAHPPYEQGEWLVLRPGVAREAPFPALRVYDALRSLSPTDLSLLLDRLGAESIPYRHEDRRRMVGELLRDHDTVTDLTSQLDADALGALRALMAQSSQRVADLGLPPFDPWSRRRGPIHDLVQAGLVGVDVPRQLAYAWLDVRYGLNERLFEDWPLRPPKLEPKPLNVAVGTLPPIVRRFAQLLDRWSLEPLPKLSAGGIGVRAIRGCAKGFGMTDGEVGLLVHVAIDMGVLGETDDDSWAPTSEAAVHVGRSVAEQWSAIVTSWLRVTTFAEDEGLPNRWGGDELWPPPEAARRVFLDVLDLLEPGEGVADDELQALMDWRYPDVMSADNGSAFVTAVRLLSLVPGDGPVGLTPAARALRAGGTPALAGVLGDVATQFIVQADHSIIAPPNLAPAVAARLAEVAELESDAGAQVWRLTGRRIAEALANGRSRDDIVDFLTDASSVPVAANVLVTVDDVAARHGRLRAGTIGCYLRCEDPVEIVGAAAISSAKLRVLAPTVAVTPLSRDALIKTLRGKGLLAVAEDGDGAIIPPRRELGTPLPGTIAPTTDLPPPPDPWALAESILS